MLIWCNYSGKKITSCFCKGHILITFILVNFDVFKIIGFGFNQDDFLVRHGSYSQCREDGKALSNLKGNHWPSVILPEYMGHDSHEIQDFFPSHVLWEQHHDCSLNLLFQIHQNPLKWILLICTYKLLSHSEKTRNFLTTFSVKLVPQWHDLSVHMRPKNLKYTYIYSIEVGTVKKSLVWIKIDLHFHIATVQI